MSNLSVPYFAWSWTCIWLKCTIPCLFLTLSPTEVTHILSIFWHCVTLNCPMSSPLFDALSDLQYIPRNMHTVLALLCFVVVIHWLIFPYPSGLLHWHCGNLTIAPVPAKQPWWIWINTSCEFIMNDCITTTKQSTTKPCAYFLGYTVGTPYLDCCLILSPPLCHSNIPGNHGWCPVLQVYLNKDDMHQHH